MTMTAATLAGPITLGLHHVGLTVPDVRTAADFFIAGLGFAQVGEVPAYPALFVSDGTSLITLWQVAEPAQAAAFDRKANIGLHHLALKLPDDAALQALHARLAAWPGVEIEFAPGPMRPGSPVNHMIIAMPGGIRIEFATPFGG